MNRIKILNDLGYRVTFSREDLDGSVQTVCRADPDTPDLPKLAGQLGVSWASDLPEIALDSVCESVMLRARRAVHGGLVSMAPDFGPTLAPPPPTARERGADAARILDAATDAVERQVERDCATRRAATEDRSLMGDGRA